MTRATDLASTRSAETQDLISKLLSEPLDLSGMSTRQAREILATTTRICQRDFEQTRNDASITSSVVRLTHLDMVCTTALVQALTHPESDRLAGAIGQLTSLRLLMEHDALEPSRSNVLTAQIGRLRTELRPDERRTTEEKQDTLDELVLIASAEPANLQLVSIVAERLCQRRDLTVKQIEETVDFYMTTRRQALRPQSSLEYILAESACQIIVGTSGRAAELDARASDDDRMFSNVIDSFIHKTSKLLTGRQLDLYLQLVDGLAAANTIDVLRPMQWITMSSALTPEQRGILANAFSVHTTGKRRGAITAKSIRAGRLATEA